MCLEQREHRTVEQNILVRVPSSNGRRRRGQAGRDPCPLRLDTKGLVYIFPTVSSNYYYSLCCEKGWEILHHGN